MRVLRVHVWRRAGNWWMSCLGRSVRDRSEMAPSGLSAGLGVLSTRSLETPSEAPSKPYKACRGAAKAATLQWLGK